MESKWTTNILDQGLVGLPGGVAAPSRYFRLLVARVLTGPFAGRYVNNRRDDAFFSYTFVVASTQVVTDSIGLKPAGAGSPFPYGLNVEPP